MAYIAHISGNDGSFEHSLEVEQEQHLVQGNLDGQDFTLDWHKLASLLNGTGGRYSLLIAGRSYEVFVQALASSDASGGLYEIFVGNERFEVTVEDARSHMLTTITQSTTNHAIVSVQAPMPGLVVDVLVTPDMSITQGQTVLILEAMKMENDLPAPCSGTIRDVHVQKGQTVDQKQLLLTIENSMM